MSYIHTSCGLARENFLAAPPGLSWEPSSPPLGARPLRRAMRRTGGRRPPAWKFRLFRVLGFRALGF